MTELEDLQLENLKLLKRRGRLFAAIIIGLVVCLALIGMLYLQTARLVGQNGTVAVQNREYIRCLAEVFVESQDHKVTSLDLDHCITTTQASPTPLPVVPQEPTPTQRSSVPSRGLSAPQTGTQPAPQPKQCTLNLLGTCI